MRVCQRAKSSEDLSEGSGAAAGRVNLETSAALGTVRGLYGAMHLHDDPPADAKPETGALAAGLRGDERIEQVRQDMGRDAGTGVGDGDLHRSTPSLITADADTSMGLTAC